MGSTEANTIENPQNSRVPMADSPPMASLAICDALCQCNPATTPIADIHPMKNWAGLPMLLALMLTFGPDAGGILFWCGMLLFAVISGLSTTSIKRRWVHITAITLLVVVVIYVSASLAWLIERTATWWTIVRGYIT